MTRWVDHPRTTIYGYVEKMVEKHVLIVEKTPRGNAYRAASADELIVLLKNQQATTEALIEKVEYMKPALQELARHVEYIPKVQYYE